MGGAAHAIGLAQWIMERDLPIRLHLLVPAVENAIGPDAFRPGDVLTMRNGLTVEIHNTDAEGRLILADALVKASEEQPDLIIDFATLTGAARVSVGTEISAMFTNNDQVAAALQETAQKLLIQFGAYLYLQLMRKFCVRALLIFLMPVIVLMRELLRQDCFYSVLSPITHLGFILTLWHGI